MWVYIPKNIPKIKNIKRDLQRRAHKFAEKGAKNRKNVWRGISCYIFQVFDFDFKFLIESVFVSVPAFLFVSHLVHYRLVRPLSTVGTRRGGWLPFFDYYIYVCLRCCVISAVLLKFDNWTFTLEQPDSCAAISFGMPLLKYFRIIYWTFKNVQIYDVARSKFLKSFFYHSIGGQVLCYAKFAAFSKSIRNDTNCICLVYLNESAEVGRMEGTFAWFCASVLFPN